MFEMLPVTTITEMYDHVVDKMTRTRPRVPVMAWNADQRGFTKLMMTASIIEKSLALQAPKRQPISVIRCDDGSWTYQKIGHRAFAGLRTMRDWHESAARTEYEILRATLASGAGA